jgi:Arc/MetJ-type ribon-helix-helix transcriptional regulator
MTVQLKPETERLVREEIQSGHFQSVDDLITRAIQVMRNIETRGELAVPSIVTRKRLVEVLTEAPFACSDLNLKRQKDYPRPVEL